MPAQKKASIRCMMLIYDLTRAHQAAAPPGLLILLLYDAPAHTPPASAALPAPAPMKALRGQLHVRDGEILIKYRFHALCASGLSSTGAQQFVFRVLLLSFMLEVYKTRGRASDVAAI